MYSYLLIMAVMVCYIFIENHIALSLECKSIRTYACIHTPYHVVWLETGIYIYRGTCSCTQESFRSMESIESTGGFVKATVKSD